MRVLVVYGTRPEAIKMCPLILEMKSRPEIECVVCLTGQHREMLDQVNGLFGIIADYDLNIMQNCQSLTDITSRVLQGMNSVLDEEKPDIMLVHGDTTTSFAAALAAFYRNIPVGHVEAGLRTYDIKSPYPEEFNRQAVDMICDYYFAPTETAKKHLLDEGKDENNIFVTGNTVIDALKVTVDKSFSDENIEWAKDSRLILLTSHRRENIGRNMEQIFQAVNDIIYEYQDVKVIYPLHKNPKVREIAYKYLKNNDRIRLIEPLDVYRFHNYIERCFLIMSDSGGVQEEAPSLGKPVLVLRENTERPEGVAAGTLKLVGVERQSVYRGVKELLDNQEIYNKMSMANNPYGDGKASKYIVDALLKVVNLKKSVKERENR